MDEGPVSVRFGHRKPEGRFARSEDAADHPVTVGDVPKSPRDPRNIEMVGLRRNPNETTFVESHYDPAYMTHAEKLSRGARLESP